jgi:hypothetical protein
MSTAPRYLPRYTAADHAAWEGDWELLDGVAVAMTPSPFGPHAEKLSRLAAILWNAIDAAGCHATVLAKLDWIVAADTVVPSWQCRLVTEVYARISVTTRVPGFVRFVSRWLAPMKGYVSWRWSKPRRWSSVAWRSCTLTGSVTAS